MEIDSQNIKNALEYSTVQFELHNPTSSELTIEIDTNTLVDTPSANGFNAFPNTLGQQIIVGTTYNGLAYDSLRKNIVAGDGFGNIRIIDTSTAQIIASSTSIPSVRMIYVPQTDLIYSISGSIIAVINPANGVQITSVSFGVGLAFNDLVYCPTNGRIYIKDGGADQKLWFFDTLTNTNVGFFQPPLGGFTNNITYSSSNDSVYIFDRVFTSVYQFSCASNTLATTIAGAGVSTIGIYNSVNNQIYYQDNGAGVIKIIDVASNTIIGTTVAGFGSGVPPSDMTYSASTNHIWIVDGGFSLIQIIDATSNLVVTTLPISAFWNGEIVYADNINTVYATPRDGAAGNFIQQIDASASQFFINGSTDFNLFIRDTLVNPKQINKIMIYAEVIANLINPLTVAKEDANGMAYSFVKLPNTSTATNQFQSQIGQIDFENYIFDVTSKLTYTIPALTTITWVIYYQQYERGDIMANKVMIKEFDAYKPSDPDTFDEAYLMETSLRPSFEKNEILNLND